VVSTGTTCFAKRKKVAPATNNSGATMAVQVMAKIAAGCGNGNAAAAAAGDDGDRFGAVDRLVGTAAAGATDAALVGAAAKRGRLHGRDGGGGGGGGGGVGGDGDGGGASAGGVVAGGAGIDGGGGAGGTTPWASTGGATGDTTGRSTLPPLPGTLAHYLAGGSLTQADSHITTGRATSQQQQQQQQPQPQDGPRPAASVAAAAAAAAAAEAAVPPTPPSCATLANDFALWAAGLGHVISRLERLPFGYCTSIRDDGTAASLAQAIVVAKCASCRAMSLYEDADGAAAAVAAAGGGGDVIPAGESGGQDRSGGSGIVNGHHHGAADASWPSGPLGGAANSSVLFTRQLQTTTGTAAAGGRGAGGGGGGGAGRGGGGGDGRSAPASQRPLAPVNHDQDCCVFALMSRLPHMRQLAEAVALRRVVLPRSSPPSASAPHAPRGYPLPPFHFGSPQQQQQQEQQQQQQRQRSPMMAVGAGSPLDARVHVTNSVAQSTTGQLLSAGARLDSVVFIHSASGNSVGGDDAGGGSVGGGRLGAGGGGGGGDGGGSAVAAAAVGHGRWWQPLGTDTQPRNHLWQSPPQQQHQRKQHRQQQEQQQGRRPPVHAPYPLHANDQQPQQQATTHGRGSSRPPGKGQGQGMHHPSNRVGIGHGGAGGGTGVGRGGGGLSMHPVHSLAVEFGTTPSASGRGETPLSAAPAAAKDDTVAYAEQQQRRGM
jgi:hypothetical protein